MFMSDSVPAVPLLYVTVLVADTVSPLASVALTVVVFRLIELIPACANVSS